MLITIIERGYEPLLQAPTLLRLNPDLNQDAQAALQEFIDQQHFERALSAVETVGQEALDLHGVSGAQLRFKLAGIQEREKRFRLRPWIWTLSRMFEAIDNLLDSLLKALPLGDALKEFKDGILAATEDRTAPDL